MRIRNRNRPDTRALRLIGLDRALSRHQLEQLALHTDVLTARPGTVLSRAGHLPRQFVAVVDGDVDITEPSGQIHTGGPGTRIGGAELLNGAPSRATVVTRSDCTLVVIFGRAFAGVARAPHSGRSPERHSSLGLLGDSAGASQPTAPCPALVRV